MSPNGDRRSYDEWQVVFNHQLDVVIVDDEGRRRCRRDGRLSQRLTRREAENYYLRNSFVRRRAGKVTDA